MCLTDKPEEEKTGCNKYDWHVLQRPITATGCVYK